MIDNKCERQTYQQGKICPVITNHPNFYISLLCVDCPKRVEYGRKQLAKMVVRS